MTTDRAISVAEMLALEAQSERLGVSKTTLMSNAGNAMADYIMKHYAPQSVLCVCGQGNNGGDGFVCAQALTRHGITAHIQFSGQADKLPPEAKHYWPDCTELVVENPHYQDYNLIIDCLLGTGISGPLREPTRSRIQKINDSATAIISCDCPSGCNPDTGEISDIAVTPDCVLCMHAIKKGISSEQYQVIALDIGLPEN